MLTRYLSSVPHRQNITQSPLWVINRHVSAVYITPQTCGKCNLHNFVINYFYLTLFCIIILKINQNYIFVTLWNDYNNAFDYNCILACSPEDGQITGRNMLVNIL